jgi:hypothetical protein
MADFTAQVFQNEYLADGATDVHAVVSVTCANAGIAGQTGTGEAAEIVIVDASGSMESPSSKIRAARTGAQAALDEIVDGTWFAVIVGRHTAELAYPIRGMVRMDADTRERAKQSVAVLNASGGTAIGTWLELATELFRGCPATQRHAILLTDGKNESEEPWRLGQAIEAARGLFQCDARGVGSDWVVEELRSVATGLMGSVDLIADPDEMEADFAAMIRSAMSRGVSTATLRVWAPQGAQVQFVRQVAPQVEDLSGMRQVVSPLIGDYATGAWGDETRDYHVAVRVPARPAGSEQLAARVQLLVGDQVVAQGLVKAIWTDDTNLTTRIDPAVAHYTGQAELAQAIQTGLAAKAAGDDRTATVQLGRAVQLAAETGNDATTRLLAKVVDVDDAERGTVRLKRDVDKLDEMALDTRSTKTTRVK